MTTRFAVPHEVQEILIAETYAAGRREICGFLLYDWTIHYMRNVSAEDTRFAMDDAELLAFYERHLGKIAGVFHSHPDGRTSPSDVDVAYAPADMRYWIVTKQGFYEWDMNSDPPQQIPT